MGGEGGTARRREAGAAAPAAIMLDLEEGVLTRDGERVRLRPKTLGVLAALIERRGAVVGQDELRARVWGRRFGNDAGPKQCIRELRRLLGDSPSDPRCIETVGRAGYRLLAPIEVVGSAAGAVAGGMAGTPPTLCVGRAAELAALAGRAAAARRGERAMAFLAGEPGAGKTRLAEAFLASLDRGPEVWIARGQCVPHAEAREPYGPLLDALGALAAGPMGPRLRPLLDEVAPAWRAQIPGLGAGEAEAPPRLLVEAGRGPTDRMLREFGALMERLTRIAPGVLLLEDLHWADPSTLAWLAAWGLRQGPARLLVIGAYRPEEAEEPLGAALRALARQRAVETLPLGGLDPAAVAEFLAERFPRHRFPSALAAALAERTEGHAILVDAVVERWSQGDIALAEGEWALRRPVADLAAEIAPGLRGLITAQIDALAPAERELLEAASVAGARFSAAAVAEGPGDLEAVERRLEALARRRRFIERAEAAHWPDGAQAAGYAFRHALHHEALYDLIPAANRQGLHRRIGARLEAAWGGAAGEIAPLLADHFERGGDWRRAALHRGRSGAAALERGAAQEAAAQFRQALALRRRGGAEADAAQAAALDRAELEALQGLGAALIVSEGFTAADLPAVYGRARALAGGLGDPAEAAPALAGLWNYHVSCADMAAAARLAEELLDLTAAAPAPLRMAAHNAAGLTRFFGGAPREALPHIAAVLALQEGGGGGAGAAALFGEDPGVVSRHYAACVHQLLGDAAEAERQFEAALAAAEALDQPFGKAQALWSGAVIAREQGDAARALIRAEALLAACRAGEIGFWRPAGELMAGWAAAVLGEAAGLDRLRAGIAGYDRMQVRSTRPYSLALLAEALARRGDGPGALGALAEARRIARATGEGWYAAEILRLRGEICLEAGRTASARRAFGCARALARAQGATLFEARAAARLAALEG